MACFKHFLLFFSQCLFFLVPEDDKSDYLKIVEGRPVLQHRMDEFELTNRNVR
jgi:hypothetical protein